MPTLPARSPTLPQAPAIGGRQPPSVWPAVGLILLVLVLAAMGGIASGFGNVLLLMPLFAVAGLVIVAMVPPAWLVWTLIVYAMTIVGPAVYFGRIESARWLTPMLALMLFVPLFARALRFPTVDVGRKQMPGFVVVLGLFVLQVAMTTAIGQPTVGEVLNAPRYYLTIAPLLLLLMFGVFGPATLERVWRLLIWFTLLQLPVAAIQHFVFAARKVREAPWDAVVGTFPGQAEGGGASHGLGVYVLTAVVFALALWRKGQMRTSSVLLVSLCALGTIALAEVKAVVLLIPVALALIFVSEIRRRPWTILIASLFGLLLAGGLLTVYDRVFYQDARASWSNTGAPTTALEGVQNQFDPDRVTKYTPPGRAASFVIWWDRNGGRGDVLHTLMGYGAASTQANRVGIGELARKYSYPLHQTTTGMLLWETGLLGHALLLLALLMAAYKASRLAKDPRVPATHAALLHAAGVGLVLQAITLPYKSFVMLTAPSQVLLALLLGFVAYWARECSVPAPAGQQPAAPESAPRWRPRH